MRWDWSDYITFALTRRIEYKQVKTQ